VKAAGKPVELIVAPNHNHYELQETLGNPYGWAGRAALAMMKLGAGVTRYFFRGSSAFLAR